MTIFFHCPNANGSAAILTPAGARLICAIGAFVGPIRRTSLKP
jgi:hypothetical protein